MSRFLLVLTLALAGCGLFDASTATPMDPSSIASLRGPIANVSLEAGVSSDEAVAIAKYYLDRVTRFNATVRLVLDRGLMWEVQTTDGLGIDTKYIYIDKWSGRITSTFGPPVESLQQLLAR